MFTEAEVAAELAKHDWVKGGDGRYVGGAVWRIGSEPWRLSYYVVIHVHGVLGSDSAGCFVLVPTSSPSNASLLVSGSTETGDAQYMAAFQSEDLVRAFQFNKATYIGSIQTHPEARRIVAEAFQE